MTFVGSAVLRERELLKLKRQNLNFYTLRYNIKKAKRLNFIVRRVYEKQY